MLSFVRIAINETHITIKQKISDIINKTLSKNIQSDQVLTEYTAIPATTEYDIASTGLVKNGVTSKFPSKILARPE